MSVETLSRALPPYARDLAQNLTAVAGETVLSEAQKWGAMVASAYAVGGGAVIRGLEEGCPLQPDALNAAKAAAALMGMNNVYYRAVHLLKNREYATIPIRLRMGAIANPGVPKVDFELWCFAVSAINGCGLCMDSHEDELRKHGVPSTVTQGALRIAAVVNAVARVLAAEDGAKA